MENEGVTLDLGNKSPDITKYDAVFLAPTIPESASIRKEDVYKRQGLYSSISMDE